VLAITAQSFLANKAVENMNNISPQIYPCTFYCYCVGNEYMRRQWQATIDWLNSTLCILINIVNQCKRYCIVMHDYDDDDDDGLFSDRMSRPTDERRRRRPVLVGPQRGGGDVPKAAAGRRWRDDRGVMATRLQWPRLARLHRQLYRWISTSRWVSYHWTKWLMGHENKSISLRHFWYNGEVSSYLRVFFSNLYTPCSGRNQSSTPRSAVSSSSRIRGAAAAEIEFRAFLPIYLSSSEDDCCDICKKTILISLGDIVMKMSDTLLWLQYMRRVLRSVGRNMTMCDVAI